jgi:hypothetical protein
LPSGELRRCRASVHGESLSFGAITDQAAQRLRERGHIVRWHQQAGARRHRVGDCACHGGHDRQPVRDRFRKRHSVPLETRREHKYVGCQIQFDDTLRWDGAEHRDPVAETVGRDVGVEPRSGGQVAGPVTSDGQPPGQVGNRGNCRDQQIVSFAVTDAGP